MQRSVFHWYCNHDLISRVSTPDVSILGTLILDGAEWRNTPMPRHSSIDVKPGGWTQDVLDAVDSLAKSKFSLAEVYKSEAKLARLHPANHFVREKIRQQLQVLRDLGILEFLGDGEYRLS